MARKIEWNGEWIATLIEAEDGSYIAAPVVFDEDDRLVMGAEILAAVVEAGTPIEHPVLHGYSPGHLAELDQHLTHVSAQLGVPLRGW